VRQKKQSLTEGGHYSKEKSPSRNLPTQEMARGRQDKAPDYRNLNETSVSGKVISWSWGGEGEGRLTEQNGGQH